MVGKEIALLFLIGHAITLSTHLVEATGIKIAAYNVRIFGTSKLQNQVAMNMITQIVRQYDIIVIQEVRGFRNPTEVPNGVLQWVNQGGNDYAICNSAYTYKPGGSSHRELYLFLYRHAVVTCVGTEESENVNGGYANSFRRPPTVGRFRVTSGMTNIDFFVVGIHTQPSAASTGRTVAEINELVSVYNTFRQRYGTAIGFVMGDYNYGGTYVSPNQQNNLMIDQPPFVRFINSTDGTTVKTPSKPYDRIYVVPGGRTIEKVGIDTFRDMLTPDQYYRSVSDHYPVYVEVNFGTSGGNAPQNFPINQNQFTAAVTEECTSVDADFDPSLDDDLEADLYQECQQCSLATGGSQQSKRQGLMIINQCSRGSATVMLSYLMVLIVPFISLILVY